MVVGKKVGLNTVLYYAVLRCYPSWVWYHVRASIMRALVIAGRSDGWIVSWFVCSAVLLLRFVCAGWPAGCTYTAAAQQNAGISPRFIRGSFFPPWPACLLMYLFFLFFFVVLLVCNVYVFFLYGHCTVASMCRLSRIRKFE